MGREHVVNETPELRQELRNRIDISTPVRRICLFAGPGAGKSTTAHWIIWRLKSLGISAEMSREWIKRWAYAGRQMDRLTDQVIVMGRQVEEEMEALATGCVVVTDSPILLQAAYSDWTMDVERAILIEQGLQQRYTSLNLFIHRGDREFIAQGRWEDAEAARAKDDQIMGLLDKAGLRFTSVRHDDYEAIWRALTQ